MSLTDVLSARININRLTYKVLDSVAVGLTLSANRQPGASCRLEVAVSGATISNGLVSVAGNVNETFSFSENTSFIGSQDFSSINVDGITISGIEDGFIEISTVTKTGSKVSQEQTIHSNIAARFYSVDGRLRRMPAGDEKPAEYKIMLSGDYDVRENDIFEAVSGSFGITRGQLSFVDHILDFSGVTHHIEAEIIPL